MNFGEIVSASRWQILENIAISPSSPIQLAEKIGTSVAYVSQQLKLLEAANLVTKNKTGAAEKGKPRNVYSIVKDIVTFSALMSGSPVQASIYPTLHQKSILKIWLYRDENSRQLIEKLYREFEDLIFEIEGIYATNEGATEIFVVSQSSEVISIVKDFSKKNKGLKISVLDELNKSGVYTIFENLEGKR